MKFQNIYRQRINNINLTKNLLPTLSRKSKDKMSTDCYSSRVRIPYNINTTLRRMTTIYDAKSIVIESLHPILHREESAMRQFFEIIKQYRSSFSANFWQFIAKMFGQNLKKRYDPTGEDAKLEELVQIWNKGHWDSFYFAIFFEYPKKTVIKRDYLQSTVESRERRRKRSEEESSLMKKGLQEAKEMLKED